MGSTRHFQTHPWASHTKTPSKTDLSAEGHQRAITGPCNLMIWSQVVGFSAALLCKVEKCIVQRISISLSLSLSLSPLFHSFSIRLYSTAWPGWTMSRTCQNWSELSPVPCGWHCCDMAGTEAIAHGVVNLMASLAGEAVPTRELLSETSFLGWVLLWMTEGLDRFYCWHFMALIC